MRNVRKSAAVAVCAALSIVFVAPIAQAGELGTAHYPCGATRPPNLDGSALGKADDVADGAAVNRGSSSYCGTLGYLREGDKLDYYCYTRGNDGFFYTYLSAYERGFAGWVDDRALSSIGSSVHCPI